MSHWHAPSGVRSARRRDADRAPRTPRSRPPACWCPAEADTASTVDAISRAVAVAAKVARKIVLRNVDTSQSWVGRPRQATGRWSAEALGTRFPPGRGPRGCGVSRCPPSVRDDGESKAHRLQRRLTASARILTQPDRLRRILTRAVVRRSTTGVRRWGRTRSRRRPSRECPTPRPGAPRRPARARRGRRGPRRRSRRTAGAAARVGT